MRCDIGVPTIGAVPPALLGRHRVDEGRTVQNPNVCLRALTTNDLSGCCHLTCGAGVRETDQRAARGIAVGLQPKRRLRVARSR